MDLQLTGKLALVTGSTAGIGLAIGSTLAGEGATVIINGRSESRVTGAIAKIRQKYPHAKLETLAGDLSKAEMVKQATGRFPHVDILINNLGIYELKSFEDISDEDWMAMIETNFMSGVRLSRLWWRRSSSKPSAPVRSSSGSPRQRKSPRWSRSSPARFPLRQTGRRYAWMAEWSARSFDQQG